MAEHPQQRSALAGLNSIAGHGVAVVERFAVTKIDVRCAATAPAFFDAMRMALGTSLPLEPNTVSTGTEARALWLGPDEWLIVSETEPVPRLAPKLVTAAEGQHVAITDVSGGRCVIGLRGQQARDLLSMGCSLDLHPRVFGVDRCAQTLLAKAAVIVHQTSEEPEFDIYVARSFAHYLWSWLADGAGEPPGGVGRS